MRERSRGAVSPGWCQFVAHSLNRGRREDRALAAPACRVQWVVKNAHGFDRYSQDIPAFPAQWLYGLYVISPGSGLSCPRHLPGLTGQLDARVAAPEPHDFTVRYGVSSGRKNPPDAASVHRNPHQRYETMRIVPFWRHGLTGNIVLIYGNVKRKFRSLANAWICELRTKMGRRFLCGPIHCAALRDRPGDHQP